MCGILGAIGRCEESALKLAKRRISIRGRDDFISLSKPSYDLSQSRLAITNINTKPKLEIDGLILLFNGEIYNYKALLKEFEKDSGDERLAIITAFRRFDLEFVNKLEGMFAIAIYDPNQNRLILVRDRFGKKPLFYTKIGKSFYFASSASALLPFLGKNSLNKEALIDYLALLAPCRDRSFYEGIKKLEASCLGVFEDGVFKTERYYSPLKKSFSLKKEDALKRVEELLSSSVKKRVANEVNSALLLSGGIDSTLVAIFSDTPTISIGYEGFEKYDESKEARRNAKLLGKENRTFIFGKDHFLSRLDEIVDVLDEPINDPASIPLLFLCQSAKEEGYKVLFSGDGGDELFLGYAFYQKLQEFEQVKHLPFKAWLKNYIISNKAQNREWEWYRRALSGEFIYRNNAECFSDLQLSQLLRFKIKEHHTKESLSTLLEAFGDEKDEIKWAQFADIYHHLSEVLLAKGDRVGMASGVEIRSPFMDRELVEFGLNLDNRVKLSNNRTKPLLRDLIERRANKEIAHRKKKGFSYPFLEWLDSSGELERIDRVNKNIGFFNKEALEFLKKQAKKGNLKRQIFGLYLFCRWFEKRF